MAQEFEARIKQMTKTLQQWMQLNPILLDGEWAVTRIVNNTTHEVTYKVKIGNGVGTYASLPYAIWSGEAGSPGASGTILNPMGEWVAADAYSVEDYTPIVSYEGTSYIARRWSIGAQPDISPMDWQVLVSLDGIVQPEMALNVPRIECKVQDGMVYVRALNVNDRFLSMNPKIAIVRYAKQRKNNMGLKRSTRRTKVGYVVTRKFEPVAYTHSIDLRWQAFATVEDVADIFIAKDGSNYTLTRRSKRKIIKSGALTDFYLGVQGGVVFVCDNPNVIPDFRTGGKNRIVGEPCYATFGYKKYWNRETLISSPVVATIKPFFNISKSRAHKL